MSNRSQHSDKVALLDPDKSVNSADGLAKRVADGGAKHPGNVEPASAPSPTPAAPSSTPSSTPASTPTPGPTPKAAPTPTDVGPHVAQETKRPSFLSRVLSWTLSFIRIILKTALPIAILFGAVTVYKHLKATAPDVKRKAKTERSFAVNVIKAVPGTQSPMLQLFGTTTAGRKVDIRALVAGQIVTTGTALREGGQVRVGETLLTIDPFDYRQARIEAQAQLASARAKLREQQASLAAEEASLRFARQQFKLSKTDLQRAVPLAKRGTVSKRTLDDRRNNMIERERSVEQLENSIRVWHARIAQQQATIDRTKSSVRRAVRKLEETKLIAPFDAYVTQVGAQVGRIVSANDKVATLIDRNWIEVRFTLSDKQFGRIMAADKTLKGRKVSVLWQVGVKPLVYEAVIERVGAQISAQSGGVEVYARLTNPLTPVELRPGAFVEIKVPDVSYANVYRLPPTVLYNGKTVYAVVDGRLVARAVVKVGISDSDVLLSGDIVPGEPVISTRLSTPGDGLKVTVQQP